MIKEWEQGEVAFRYEETENGIRLVQWKGNGSCAKLPEEIHGMPLTVIGKKAFLSNKRILEIYLPDGIREIGDWAFAYCGRLNSIFMPQKDITFGKGVFLECQKLEQIRLHKVGEAQKDGRLLWQQIQEPDDIGSLLAAVVHKMDAPYLFDLMEAGEKDWIQKWDARLLQILHTPDREGYSKTILCGEEDYGSMESNLDFFLSQKRRSKVRLALIRLLHTMGLSEEMRQQLEEYLRSYTKGCMFEETWLVVKEEYGGKKEYYDLLVSVGALTEQNFDGVLSDMGNELAEMKAYLLKQKEKWFGQDNFFDSLSL